MHFQLLKKKKNQRRENFTTFCLTNIMNYKKESENRNMINMSDKAYHPKKWDIHLIRIYFQSRTRSSKSVHIFRLLSLPATLLFRKTKPVHRNINHVPFLHSITQVSFYHCWVFWLNRHLVPYSQLRFLSLIRVCIFSCDDFSLYKQLISLPKEFGWTIPQRKKKIQKTSTKIFKTALVIIKNQIVWQ